MECQPFEKHFRGCNGTQLGMCDSHHDVCNKLCQMTPKIPPPKDGFCTKGICVCYERCNNSK